MSYQQSDKTRALLGCAIAVGPLFVLVVLLQAGTRRGFDLGRHPISLLSLGSLGWIQIANFVVSGAVFAASAVGLRQELRNTWGGAVIPFAVAALGVGSIIAGVFVTDPGAGFPPGAPDGAPERMSWHGLLHEVGFVVAQLGWLVFVIAMIRRSTAKWPWITALVAVLALVAWPSLDGFSVRLLLATAIEFGAVAMLARRLLRSAAAMSENGQRLRRI
ncbi:DUF998 domain-containing protein [Nocardia sp. CA-129566]|uniref:DUF998 domain-containing protein n=1 Tax=Nocardia sp. CA-129566 TaxID=3239976 RepID=UPI003D95A7CF